MEGIKGTLRTLWPGGGTVSAAVCSILFQIQAHTQWLWKQPFRCCGLHLDLVSQTKMGQLFKLLDLLSRLQVLKAPSLANVLCFLIAKTWEIPLRQFLILNKKCFREIRIYACARPWTTFKLIWVPGEIPRASIYMH